MKSLSINILQRTDFNISVPLSHFTPFNSVPGLAQAFI